MYSFSLLNSLEISKLAPYEIRRRPLQRKVENRRKTQVFETVSQ
jgi:hypothetical protein